MKNNCFKFKQFTIAHEKSVMKVGTDGVLLGAWADASEVKKILDIGTGTGIIAIMMAQKSNAVIDAVEIDEVSYSEAKQNIYACPWKDRIALFYISFQEFLKIQPFPYDLIVSNPPFFCNAFKPSSIKKITAKHNDGLLYNELIEGVAKLLDDNGKFAIIMPHTEGLQLIKLAEGKSFFCNKITFVKPKPEKPVKRVLIEFGKIKKETERTTLFIRNQDNSFTSEYKELTKNFYLAF